MSLEKISEPKFCMGLCDNPAQDNVALVPKLIHFDH
jgi:hypothetical protein